jgi:hypothetical protein
MTSKNVRFRPPGLRAQGIGNQKYRKLLIFQLNKSGIPRIQTGGDAHLPSEDGYKSVLNEEFDNESE